MTVFPKDISLPTTSQNRHHAVATCPITVAGAVSAIHVSGRPTCDRANMARVGSRGPRCVIRGRYVAGIAWCRVKVGMPKCGPKGTRVAFLQIRMGPGGDGMGFLWEVMSYGCVCGPCRGGPRPTCQPTSWCSQTRL